MAKKVYRYFIDFTDSQQKWLNEMSDKGFRLVECGQLAYIFEECKPGEYEYAVEFAADKSNKLSKDYKQFIDSVGYKTIIKNINAGIFVGKIKWRPWANGMGQIATSPGNLQKELLIIEKKKDGKPLELRTNLDDKILYNKTLRNAYLWAGGSMFCLVIMCLAYFIWTHMPYLLIMAVIFAVISFLWLTPSARYMVKIKNLKEKRKINE